MMSAIESAFCRSRPWTRFADRTVLPWALQGVAPAGSLRELGAGSGAMAAGTARANPQLSLTVTDLDPSMIAAAEHRLADYTNVTVQVADVMDLPFDAQSFDVVASYLMLHHVIEWRTALAEATRVLKPGGRLIGYDLERTWIATAIHRLDRSPFALLIAAELRTALADAGFTKIEVRPDFGRLAMRLSAQL